MHWGGRGHAGLTTTVDGGGAAYHRNAQSLAGPIFSEDSMSLVLMQDHRRSGRSILYDSRVARRSASGGSGGGNSGRTGGNRGRTGGNRGVRNSNRRGGGERERTNMNHGTSVTAPAALLY